jgi:hypothetical protein
MPIRLQYRHHEGVACGGNRPPGGGNGKNRPQLPRGTETNMIALSFIRKRATERNTLDGALAAAIFCLALAAPAFADGDMPDSEHGRYAFFKVAEGFLRLDIQTGAVSVCSQRAVGFACQAAPDDRTVLENEIARLRAENAALKKEMLAHGLVLPGTAGAAQESQAPHDNDITIRLPDNAEIDRMVAYAGQLWQRFVEAIARGQKQVLNNKS